MAYKRCFAFRRKQGAKLCQRLRRYPPTLTDARNWLPKQVRYRTAPRPELPPKLEKSTGPGTTHLRVMK